MSKMRVNAAERRAHAAAKAEIERRELATLPLFDEIFGAVGARSSNTRTHETDPLTTVRGERRSKDVILVLDDDLVAVSLGQRFTICESRQPRFDDSGDYSDSVTTVTTKRVRNALHINGRFQLELQRPG